MKTKLSLFSLILSCLLIGTVSAQDMAFRVLASKGMNSVDAQNLRIGSKITSNQSIKVGAESYLGLAHKSGKTLELKEAGTYKVADLEAKLSGTAASGVTSKYIDFVTSELSKKEDANAMARRYKHMSKTGAVVRGGIDPIDLMLEKKHSVLGGEIAILWHLNERLPAVKPETVSGYKVVVRDLFGEILEEVTLEADQNMFILNIEDDKLKGESQIAYKVMALGDNAMSSSEQMLTKMTAESSEEKYADYEILRHNNTALGKIIQAKYLEEQDLLSEAMAAYHEALTLEVGVEAYQTLYDEFMNRTGFSKEAYLANSKKDTE